MCRYRAVCLPLVRGRGTLQGGWGTERRAGLRVPRRGGGAAVRRRHRPGERRYAARARSGTPTCCAASTSLSPSPGSKRTLGGRRDGPRPYGRSSKLERTTARDSPPCRVERPRLVLRLLHGYGAWSGRSGPGGKLPGRALRVGRQRRISLPRPDSRTRFLPFTGTLNSPLPQHPTNGQLQREAGDGGILKLHTPSTRESQVAQSTRRTPFRTTWGSPSWQVR